MFSLSKIKNKKAFLLQQNMKNKLIAIAILSTLFNRNINATSSKVSLMIASLAGGFAVYKCLSYFTPTSELNEAKNILNSAEKKIQKIIPIKDNEKDIIKDTSDNTEKFKNVISKKYVITEDYPEIHFKKKDLKKLDSDLKKAKVLIKSSIDKPSIITNLYIWINDLDNDALKKELASEENKCEKLSKAIKDINDQIEKFPNFDKRLKSYKKSERKDKKDILIEEKIKHLKNKNSFSNFGLHKMLENPAFLDIFLQLFISLYIKAQTLLGLAA